MNFNDNGIFGFDISRWQDANTTPQQVDFNKMKAYGASFVIIKAGQWYWQDEDFAYNWAEAKKAGLPRASYWFADINETGKVQANNYWTILKANGWEGEVCVIDYENGSWTNWNELYNFIVEFQRLSGIANDKMWIYTGYPYWTNHRPTNATSLDWFKKYPLWLAWYTSNPANVLVPAPWTSVVLWQDGTPAIGAEAGVESKEIDHNKLNGGQNELVYYFGGAVTPPPPPPTGGNMYECVKDVAIRDGSSYYNSNKVDVLYVGDKVEAVVIETPTDPIPKWLKFTEIQRSNGTVKTFSSPVYCSANIAYVQEIIVTPPPPVGHTVSVRITIDGVVSVDETYNV